jgi:hypothetical protein
MGMKLSAVKGKIKTAQITWEDETVEVGYHPAAMTPELLERVDASGKAESLAVLGVLLEPLLAYWDVLDDDDKRLPTDAATIATIPLPFLMAVMDQVQESMRPPADRG